MPGHAGSPFWATVDFDSDGEEDQSTSPTNRLYLDPWDNEAYAIAPQPTESSQGENFNSFAGEPVSASFYYVPTKTYDEEEAPSKRVPTPPENVMVPDYGVYGRKRSRVLLPEIHADLSIYNPEIMMKDRRRSIYNMEEPVYTRHPIIYEPLYGPIVPPPPLGYVPPAPRSRMSLPLHNDYVMNAYSGYGYGRPRRHSRLTDAYEHMTYESLSPEYEDWARPCPKAAPDNFHLSRYGHLQIDYSFSWTSLDRLIRNH